MIQVEVEVQDVDHRLAQEAELSATLIVVHHVENLCLVMPRAWAILGAWISAYSGEMSGSSPLALAVTASAGTTGCSGAAPRICTIWPTE